MDFITACKEFGIVGGLLLVIIAGVLTMCGFGFKWILEQFKIELDGNRKERTEYLNILNKIGEKMDAHDERTKEAHASVSTEHKEMIQVLGRINGWKHD